MPEDLDFSTFEPLHGKRPFQLLDRHPDGQLVALQVVVWIRAMTDRAGVWDQHTGKLAWAPEGVSALAWLQGGKQVAMIQEAYHRAPDHPAVIGSPLQREFTYTFVRAMWPQRGFIDSCRLHFPTGWPTDLIISPREDLAIVQWHDQGESGLEFVALGDASPQQIEYTGLPHLAPLRLPGGKGGGGFPLNTPFVFRPVFSPGGRYIVVAWQDEAVWWDPRAYDASSAGKFADPTSPGGECTMGTISVINWNERTHYSIPLVEILPAGWRPEPREDGGEGLLFEPPVFVDAEHFTLALPTGETRTFSVR
jgi:hypothetical protein